MDSIIKRLKEPSTHAGLAALCGLGATFLPQYSGLFNWVGAGLATLATVTPERGQ